MILTKAYAAHSPTDLLSPYTFNRREPGPNDVVIDILFCGICHSDIHQVRNEWSGAKYPMVPGHEIIGRVSRIGNSVTKFKPGDLAGIGCFIDSCRTCIPCRNGIEQYCENGMSATYNSFERDKITPTFGGYSTCIVADEKYTLKIDRILDPAGAAPLLCAGVTTWSPLKHLNIMKGHRVAVAGLGGLGHMAVKFAVALGAEVTSLSTSESKRVDAEKLGASDFILTRGDLKKYEYRFDCIINTIAAHHDINPYLRMLTLDGTMVMLGIPPEPVALQVAPLIMKRRRIMGSLIGGIRETQEMLDFCAIHKITSDVEVIPASYINEAYERTIRSDVKYRFVIDCSTF